MRIRPTMARTAGSSSTIKMVPFPVTARRLARLGGGYNRDVGGWWRRQRRTAHRGAALTLLNISDGRALTDGRHPRFGTKGRSLEENEMICLALMTGLAAFVGV